MKLRQFTLDEYYRLGEVGILGPEERTELIDGIIYEKEKFSPYRCAVGSLLHRDFVFAENRGFKVRGSWPLHVDSKSAPEPDLSLVQRQSYKTRHPEAADVFTVIEITDGSTDKPVDLKLPLYCRSGIPEYWIINLELRTFDIYREPRRHGYATHSTHRKGDYVSPERFPDVQINIAELLRKED